MKNRIPVSENEQRALMVDLLDEIDAFCKQRDIPYFISYGTLIGAVRHKGFIPWDDDIDVCMFREDYERFVREFHSDRPEIRLLSFETDPDYNRPFAKVSNENTIFIENAANTKMNGIYVDIFPLDYCQNPNEPVSKHIKKIKLLRWLKDFKVIRFSRKRSFVKNAVLAVGKIVTAPFSVRSLAMKLEKCCKTYSRENSAYVGCLVDLVYGLGDIFPVDWLTETTELEFEGKFYPAPKRYHDVLTKQYGDYMQLPPVEKRKRHSLEIYWK